MEAKSVFPNTQAAFDGLKIILDVDAAK